MKRTRIKDISFYTATSDVSRPIADATHTISTIDFIIAEIELENGIIGQGYLLSFDFVPQAISGALADIKNFILSKGYDGTNPPKLIEDWRGEVEYFGQEGLLAWAGSIISIAMWDARGKAESKSIVDLLGGKARKIPVYGSGGWLSYSDGELVDEAISYKKREFRAVKIKVGAGEPGCDLHRLRLVREAVGKGMEIMMDANQGLDYDRARSLADEASKLDIAWLEEPFGHRDFNMYELLSNISDVKLAMGEREYDLTALIVLAGKEAIHLWQPDIIRIGGVEKWLESAAVAASYGIPTLPHFYKDYDVPLMCAIPKGHAIEYFDWIDGLTDNKLEITDGYAIPRDGPGWGFSFKEKKLKVLQI